MSDIESLQTAKRDLLDELAQAAHAPDPVTELGNLFYQLGMLMQFCTLQEAQRFPMHPDYRRILAVVEVMQELVKEPTR